MISWSLNGVHEKISMHNASQQMRSALSGRGHTLVE